MSEVIQLRKNDYWGLCPKCKGEPLFRNVKRTHWAACDTHKVTWLVGDNLFSGWQDETPEIWEANCLVLSGYGVVKPFFYERVEPSKDEHSPCTKS